MPVTRQLGVVMDPIDAIKPQKDSTLALLLEAQRRGYRLHYMEPRHLFLDGAEPAALTRPLTVRDDPDAWFSFNNDSDGCAGGRRGAGAPVQGVGRLDGGRQASRDGFTASLNGSPRPPAFTSATVTPLTDLDVILMRQDPPVDATYLHATHVLEAAERQGVVVVNRPGAVRDAHEKLFALHWPHLCPPTRVAADPGALRDFIRTEGKAVLKPLDAMGGASIFVVEDGDPNTTVILETLTDHGRRHALAQRYLPEIAAGDKRILVFDGEPYPHTLARIPAGGETRGNLAAGGRGELAGLTDADRKICAELAPALRERGLLFTGLDVIGGFLTEVNVTSPTCIREIDALSGTNASAALFDAIERRAA